MRRSMFVLCGFLLSQCTFLEGQVTFESYLNTELSSAGDSTLSSRMTIPKYKAPLVKRWDFRTDIDEFESQRQQYEIRPNLTSAKVRKYQNALYSNYLDEYELEYQKARRKDVSVFYKTWLDALFLERKLTLDKESLPLLEDQLRLKQSSDTKGEVSIYDILDAQRDLERLKWDISESESGLDNLFRTDGVVVNVAQLIAFAEAYMLAGQLIYPDFNEDALDLEKLENEFLLEKAKTNQVIDFVRFNYNGPHSDPFKEKFSLGLSMNFRRSDRKELGIVERQIETEIEEVRMGRKQVEYRQALELAMGKLRMAVEGYNNYQNLNQRLRTYDKVLEEQAPLLQSDLLKWLDLRVEQLKSEKLLLNYEKEVFFCYLEWLKSSGLLERYSSFNFLNVDLSFSDL